MVLLLLNLEKPILKGSKHSPVVFTVQLQMLQLWFWAWEPENEANEKQPLVFHRSCINREPGRALKSLRLSLKFKTYMHAQFLLQSIAIACIWIAGLALPLPIPWAKSEFWLCYCQLKVSSPVCARGRLDHLHPGINDQGEHSLANVITIFPRRQMFQVFILKMSYIC